MLPFSLGITFEHNNVINRTSIYHGVDEKELHCQLFCLVFYHVEKIEILNFCLSVLVHGSS